MFIDAVESVSLTQLLTTMTGMVEAPLRFLAGVSLHRKTPLCIVDGNLTVQRCADGILELVVVPFVTQMPQDTIFKTTTQYHMEAVLLMAFSDSISLNNSTSLRTRQITTQSLLMYPPYKCQD